MNGLQLDVGTSGNRTATLSRYVLFGLLTLGLVACDGGGGNGGEDDAALEIPTAPLLSLSPQSIKTFSFDWADVSAETEYRLLENPDGMSGYTQVATIGADITGHDHQVFLPGRVNASYILQACNSAGCSDSSSVFVSGTLKEAVGYLKASNTGSNDRFGQSVALAGDGDTLAVGAWIEGSDATGINGAQGDNPSSEVSGAVYVFVRSGATWSQQAYVKASNAGMNDRLGWSIALSNDGDTLAVGAHYEQSNATGIDGDQINNAADLSGAVYVFHRSGTTWSQQAYIKASNTGLGDWFGFRVTLSGDGNTLAASALREDSSANGIDGAQDNNLAARSGAVYLFTRRGATWEQQSYIKASNTERRDRFGSSLSLSGDGNTLAVGAPREDSNANGIGGNQSDNSATNSGAVYLFSRSGASWSQQAYIKASNTDAEDQFGHSVALSGNGNTLAVGAPGEQSNATGVDGNQSDNSITFSGAVYVFTRSMADWTQQAYIKASNTKASNTGGGGQFGDGVSLSGDGDTLAVGAPSENGASTGIGGDQSDNSVTISGAVYILLRSSGNWSQHAYVKASNTESDDRFGISVSLAADNSIMAVGAPFENSIAIGINSDQSDNAAEDSGAVYLY